MSKYFPSPEFASLPKRVAGMNIGQSSGTCVRVHYGLGVVLLTVLAISKGRRQVHRQEARRDE
jgi:hypothetical protein